MHSPLLEKLDVLVLRACFSHSLSPTVGAAARVSALCSATQNKISAPLAVARRSHGRSVSVERARRHCSKVVPRDAQCSANPDGKHTRDAPTCARRFFTVAPRPKNVPCEGGWLAAFLRLCGEHQTQNLESRSTLRSDRTVGFFFLTRDRACKAAVHRSLVASADRTDRAPGSTPPPPMSDDNAAPPPPPGPPPPGAPKMNANAPAFSFNPNASAFAFKPRNLPAGAGGAGPAPPAGPPPGGPPVFFERPAPPSGPPAKAKTLVIGGEAPKKAAQVTIGGDGAPQFFERPAPPEGAPAKARTLVIGGDAPPKKAASVSIGGPAKVVSIGGPRPLPRRSPRPQRPSPRRSPRSLPR